MLGVIWIQPFTTPHYLRYENDIMSKFFLQKKQGKSKREKIIQNIVQNMLPYFFNAILSFSLWDKDNNDKDLIA